MDLRVAVSEKVATKIVKSAVALFTVSKRCRTEMELIEVTLVVVKRCRPDPKLLYCRVIEANLCMSSR